MLLELLHKGRYYRVDYQWPPATWHLWYYRVYFDGHHTALHLGPLIVSWGDA